MRHALALIMIASAALLMGCPQKPAPQAAVVPPPPTPPPPTTLRPIDELPPATPPAETLPPAPPKPVTPAASAAKTYIVQKGDTLFSIAKTQLGNGGRWKDIVAANPGLSEKIQPGQKLNLPAK